MGDERRLAGQAAAWPTPAQPIAAAPPRRPEPGARLWAEVRAAHPGVGFVRMINVDEGTQAFVEPAPARVFPNAGDTVIYPAPAERLHAQALVDIVRRFDGKPYTVRLRETEPA